MFKILFMPFIMIFKIISLPFRILFSNKENRNEWGLTKEDKKIAKEERMTDADYIEAEERDDDNLDTDDDW